MKPSKTASQPGASKPAAKKSGRKRIDWEAIERDYRTAKFTLRELEAKHGASYSEISRKAKKEAWQKDLAAVIRQATNVALLSDVATKAQGDATTVVLVAAEVNKQVILGHRKALHELGFQADAALDKLMALADTVADVREAATVMGAIESYGRILKLRAEKEREAFGINDADKPEDKAPPVDWASKTAEDGMAAYLRLVHGQ